MADTSLTYLGGDTESSFEVRVSPPNDGTKPAIGSPMMGPMVEFIQHFWPMWEGAGTDLIDLGIGLSASIIGADITWGAASRGIGLDAAGFTAGTDDVTVPQIVLSKGYSLERLFTLDSGTTWIHELIVNDPDNDEKVVYHDGVVVEKLAYDPSDASITSLLAAWGAYDLAIAGMGIEYVRIWNRALEAFEVADLYSNPYLMFGVSQEILNEIITVIDFMKPMGTEFSITEES